MNNTQEFGRSVGPDKVMCRFKWDYPIVNMMSGHIRGCCRTPKQVLTEEQLARYGKNAIMNLPYERERRLEKLRGVTHADCQSCLHLESQGASAPRTGTENFMLDYWNRREPFSEPKAKWKEKFQAILARELTIDSPEVYSHHPSMLEIVLGNICDLKCTYCSAHYSTQWAKELIDYGEMSKETYNHEFPDAPESLNKVFWEWFYDEARYSLKRINFLGGEPTYIPKFYTFLDQLILAYKDLDQKLSWPVELGVITNLNCTEPTLNKFTDRFTALTEQFSLRIEPSMEALGTRAEYIRQNLSWETFERNIHTILQFAKLNNYQQKQFILSFQMALNTFSISSLPGFIKWVQSLIDQYDISIGLAPNLVSFPRHHNPTILTPDFASYIKESLEFIKVHEEKNDRTLQNSYWPSSWRSYRLYHLSQLYESMLKESKDDFLLTSRIHFYNFVETIKHRRQKDFLDFFPEYRNFYELCAGAYNGR